jgi:hypothetical protein
MDPQPDRTPAVDAVPADRPLASRSDGTMSAHTQAFALRISKNGSTPMWYAWNAHLGHVGYMACLANAELYPTRDRAEAKAASLRADGHDVEIVTVRCE